MNRGAKAAIDALNRNPIVSWMKGNADESPAHAHKAGELITLPGGHPSLKIGPLLETEQHDIGDILRESLEVVAPAWRYGGFQGMTARLHGDDLAR